MPSRSRSALALAALSGLLLLLIPAGAAAAIRFAGPGGTGQNPCADPANPCSLVRAAGRNEGAQEGDEVILESGEYSDTAGDFGGLDRLALVEGVSMHGAKGQPRPVIRFLGHQSFGFPVLSVVPDGAISHVEIETQFAEAIGVFGGTVEDVVARSSGEGITVCRGTRGVLRNAACLSTGEQGGAVGAFNVVPVDQPLRLRNVTAIASGADSIGLFNRGRGTQVVHSVVDAKSVIAKGTKVDVEALAIETIPTGPTVEINLDHSDFATAVATADPRGEATVTAPGSPTNLTDLPQLAIDGYHQLQTSKTVDSGDVDASSGLNDIDGEVRAIGNASDIGADESGLDATVGSVSCVPSGLAIGQGATCTMSVKDIINARGRPEGEVEFASDHPGDFTPASGKCELEALATAEASCHVTYTASASGAHSLTADYEGDASRQRLSGVAHLTVTRHQSATAVACAPASLLLGGGAATCTATVADNAANPKAPNGEVTFASNGPGAFSDGGACTLTGAKGGEASCRIRYSPSLVGSGAHLITVSYKGDLAHEASQAQTRLGVTEVPPVKGGPLRGAPAPNTTLKKRPHKQTAIRRVRFTFVSDQPRSTFQCKLDKKAFRPCRSPFKKLVKPGRHTFRVRAVNSAGVPDPTPAVFGWKVGRPAR